MYVHNVQRVACAAAIWISRMSIESWKASLLLEDMVHKLLLCTIIPVTLIGLQLLVSEEKNNCKK